MAVDDLPLPVVNFLNVIGVPWPYLNEGTVVQFASLVRQFRQAVITTHQDATQAVGSIARAHRGASSEVMTSGWANLTAAQVDAVAAGCTVLADALDAAAGYIVAQKVVAVADLVALAAAFVTEEVVTAGLGTATLGLLREAGAKLVQSLVMDLQQYIAGYVIEGAARPLFAKIKAMLSGLDWSQSGGTAGDQQGLSVNPAAVAAQTAMLRQQAAALRQQAGALATAVRQLKFA